MEFMGILAFIYVISNMDLPDNFKKLKEDVRKLKSSIKGDCKMSEMLKELVGKRCTIIMQGGFSGSVECEVINVDGEWMKINQILNKKQRKIKIIRIDDIKDVSMSEKGLE